MIWRKYDVMVFENTTKWYCVFSIPRNKTGLQPSGSYLDYYFWLCSVNLYALIMCFFKFVCHQFRSFLKTFNVNYNEMNANTGKNLCKYIKMYANTSKWMKIHQNVCKYRSNWAVMFQCKFTPLLSD